MSLKKNQTRNKNSNIFFKSNNNRNILKMKKINLRQSFNESLIKVCSESTSHGLPNIFRTQNWLIRIFWTILLATGTSAALYCKKKKLKLKMRDVTLFNFEQQL